jgi:hypothetical protein
MLAILFMNVTFFTPKGSKVRIETEPGFAPASKQPEALCGDFERFVVGMSGCESISRFE